MNTAWVIASLIILIGGIVEHIFGTAFIAAQALAVALFASLQVSALRRAHQIVA